MNEEGRFFSKIENLKEKLYAVARGMGDDRIYIDDVIEAIENEAVEMPQMDEDRCDYCRGTVFTDKPFTVITQRGNERRVIFNFCPYCGAKMEREYE